MNVWCVGRNYVEHIKELGNQADLAQGLPKTPMIFLKSGSTLLHNGETITLPSWSQDVQHEIELAVELGEDLQPVRVGAALDLTLRDVQNKLKKAQHPWTLAKSFPCSSPVGSMMPIKSSSSSGSGDATAVAVDAADLQNMTLQLTVNGKVRQHGSTSHMIFTVPVLLDYIKKHFPVVPGDLVLTGTPHGVSGLQHGDNVRAWVLAGDRVISEGHWKVQRAQQ
eukprot:CAMPEP_0202905878 /NCGR_PEP_ID=MMETSP1392-20130828/36451_1 /ASSEMBLY_ACC=CAM_ASM_000868 /TAXON_ID=225041 /ORGANISM="Chlamydomonas chlamydogama, Strain SAG 11-48b" /LENGTH=222 /DNA_ID=CAMNT_0049594175 /DNA_START=90 /DNA_END=758 /DNA_ORIENTATION=+